MAGYEWHQSAFAGVNNPHSPAGKSEYAPSNAAHLLAQCPTLAWGSVTVSSFWGLVDQVTVDVESQEHGITTLHPTHAYQGCLMASACVNAKPCAAALLLSRLPPWHAPVFTTLQWITDYNNWEQVEQLQK
eukprot:scaffold298584_cov20-Tisochrysis_lutea.AAC.1